MIPFVVPKLGHPENPIPLQSHWTPTSPNICTHQPVFVIPSNLDVTFRSRRWQSSSYVAGDTMSSLESIRPLSHNRQPTLTSLLVDKGIFVGLARPPGHKPLTATTRPVIPEWKVFASGHLSKTRAYCHFLIFFSLNPLYRKSYPTRNFSAHFLSVLQ